VVFSVSTRETSACPREIRGAWDRDVHRDDTFAVECVDGDEDDGLSPTVSPSGEGKKKSYEYEEEIKEWRGPDGERFQAVEAVPSGEPPQEEQRTGARSLDDDDKGRESTTKAVTVLDQDVKVTPTVKSVISEDNELKKAGKSPSNCAPRALHILLIPFLSAISSFHLRAFP